MDKKRIKKELSREFDIIEILISMEEKIENCKTRRGVHALEILEYGLNEELDEIQKEIGQGE